MTLIARLEARVGALEMDACFATGAGPLVVIGPNGAGKTTLLSMLLGLHPVARGRIDVAGEMLLDTSRGIDVPAERRRLGYVPQDYALFPHLTVRGNVGFGVRPDRQARVHASAGVTGGVQSQVDEVLADLGLLHLADRMPVSLSGGERQRVALARALAAQPRALLLDEPLAALDVRARGEVRAFLSQTLRRLALPTVIVTHDPDDARLLGERIALLERGRIVRTGTWGELSSDADSAFLAAFVAGSAEIRR